MDYPIRWKQCVSCQYWVCKREYLPETDRVGLEGGNKTIGKCIHPTNNYGGLPREAKGVCPEWTQWDTLPNEEEK